MAGTERILRLPLWAAVLLAAGAGAILDAAFPDRGWWVLAPVAVFLMLVALLGRGPWTGLLVGLVGGLSFWLIHISWLTLYLGPVPWLALAVLQALFFGVGLALITVVLLLVSPSSTAVDRMALYLIPIQIFVFARLPDLGGKDRGLTNVLLFSVLGFYAAVMAVWLNFAAHAYAWIPYRFYLLEPF